MPKRYPRSALSCCGVIAVAIVLIASAAGSAGARTRSAKGERVSTRAPHLVAVGEMLFWNRVGRARRYVVLRDAPGRPRERYVVRRNAIVTPRAPGQTVRYRVRVKARKARWTRAVSIAYPTDAQLSPPPRVMPTFQLPPALPAPAPPAEPTQPPAPAPAPTPPPAPAPAPAPAPPLPEPTPLPAPDPPPLPEPDAEPGPPAAEPEPPAEPVPGDEDPAEAPPEAAPPEEEPPPDAVPPPDVVPPPAASPAAAGTGLVMGSSLSYELPFAVSLGARTVRLEASIGTPASQLRSTIGAYAEAGIRPLLLAGFRGRLPTTAEAQNLASWAAEFGPGGTFWTGRDVPAGVAVTHIEFGNETSYSYQFADTSGVANFWTLPAYEDRARTYALRLQEARAAIAAENPAVGLLAIGEADGGGSAWTRLMFEAVPQLGQLVSGWTVHPYGPKWRTRMDGVLANARSQGAPDTVPLWVTEWGLATDDGRCLDDNYGWDACMTYDEAAATVDTVLPGMRDRYDERLAGIYIYQAHDQQPPGASASREHYFGALQATAEPKGAYTAAVRAHLATDP